MINLTKTQGTYLNDKSEKNLIALYKDFKYNITIIAKDILRKQNMSFTKEQLNEMVDTVSNNIVEKYIKNDTYMITFFTSYFYQSIKNYIYDNYYKKSKIAEADISTLRIESSNNLEDDYIVEESILEIEKYISNLIIYYTKDYTKDVYEEILYHYKKVLNRGKSIDSYLYLIKRKEVRDIFVDLMAEVKVYLSKRS